MAEYHHHQEEDPLLLSLEDSLYCEEEHWEAEDQNIIRPDEAALLVFGDNEEGLDSQSFNYFTNPPSPTIFINNHNQYDESGTTSSSTIETHHDSSSSSSSSSSSPWGWEHNDHELTTLLTKEENLHSQNLNLYKTLSVDPNSRRDESVEWILHVCNHYSFSLLTASLAVDYFDRFLYRFSFQSDKPWMSQLASVACLSLAAKMEETHVPLLLDLQVGDIKYVFEAKTIQRMEILVLSTLEWKMSSVTACSFLDYFVRRMGFIMRWEFLRRCEEIILATLSDCRFLCYPSSVLTSATMLHVIHTFEPCSKQKFKEELTSILGNHKDNLVSDCGDLISELALEEKINHFNFNFRSNKRRKPVSSSSPGSPNGVIDVSFSSDSSNDSWAVSSTSSSVSSSPERVTKRMKTDFPDLQLWRRFSDHPSVRRLT